VKYSFFVSAIFRSHHIPIRLNDAPKVQQSRLQHVTWLGNTTALILVAENDIYVRLSPDGGQDFRLTVSGQPGTIYNGIPDWLYQGEWYLLSPELLWDTPSPLTKRYLRFLQR
jgi:hypothetical protein